MEWERYKAGIYDQSIGWHNECQPLTTVYHVAHVEAALRIMKDQRVKAGLVFDKSKLNKQRILVNWLSPNIWFDGSRYGNVGFEMDFRQLIEFKNYYWVEIMTEYNGTYGWSYIGSARGNVHYDNLEVTRQVRQFMAKDTNKLSGSDLLAFHAEKRDWQKQKAQADQTVKGIEGFESILDGITAKMGKTNPALADFKAFQPAPGGETYVTKVLIEVLGKSDDFAAFKKDQIDVEAVQEEGLPTKAAKLLQDLKKNHSHFIIQLIISNSPDNLYYQTPILAQIPVNEFVDAYLSLSNASKYHFYDALEKRYDNGHFIIELQPEKDWWEQVSAKLAGEKAAFEHKVTGKVLERAIAKIGGFIAKLGGIT